jgi:hypothetical protein
MVTLATTRVLQPTPVSPKSARQAATPESTTAIAGGLSVLLQTSPALTALTQVWLLEKPPFVTDRRIFESGVIARMPFWPASSTIWAPVSWAATPLRLEKVRFSPFALPGLASVDSATVFATEELFVPGLPWTMTEKIWSGCACASAMRLAGTMAELP